MSDILTIEDDDGFKTEWPWPEHMTMLSNSKFVEICEASHDALKGQQEEGDD